MYTNFIACCVPDQVTPPATIGTPWKTSEIWLRKTMDVPAQLQRLREARWPEAKAWAWYAEAGPIAGCNYLPRTAVNMTELWQKETFDPKTIDEELGWAEKAGYNSLRVFVQYLVWKHDPEGIVKKSWTCRGYNRPVLCTEWLRRQSGNTFEAILPIFASGQIGGFHWGLVAGRTQTYMPWGSKKGDPPPKVWQHDLFHGDGKPYRAEEIKLFRQYLLAGQSNERKP